MTCFVNVWLSLCCVSSVARFAPGLAVKTMLVSIERSMFYPGLAMFRRYSVSLRRAYRNTPNPGYCLSLQQSYSNQSGKWGFCPAVFPSPED